MNNGISIPNVGNTDLWNTTTESGMCYFLNDITTKYTTGGIYNWYAINSGLLCSTGYHAPDEEEFKTLFNNTGNSALNLESTENNPWGTNLSNFSVLYPGAMLYSASGEMSNYQSQMTFGCTSAEKEKGSHVILIANTVLFSSKPEYNPMGFCIRCIQNNIIENAQMAKSIGDFDMIVYPNPFDNQLYIKTDEFSDKLVLTIYNEVGQSVYHCSFASETTVRTKDFAPGLYLISIQSGNNHFEKKLIKK